MEKTFITGVSGTGKSTIIEGLQRRGLAAFDIDEVEGACEWRSNIANEKTDYFSGIGKNWLQENSWICDFNLVEQKINSFVSADKVYVAGITTNQLEHLAMFDQIYLLKLESDTLLKRLNARKTNDFASDGEEQKYILEIKAGFEEDMIAQGAIAIDATGVIDEIIDQILSGGNEV